MIPICIDLLVPSWTSYLFRFQPSQPWRSWHPSIVMAVSLLNLGESTTQTIGAFLVRMSSVISLSPPDLSRKFTIIFSPFCSSHDSFEFWSVVEKKSLRSPFFWGWISIGFRGVGRFCSADSARSSFQPELAIGPLLGPQLKWRSWHPVMVEERRGGWGQCNTHLVAITQKQDGMFFVACFCLHCVL